MIAHYDAPQSGDLIPPLIQFRAGMRHPSANQIDLATQCEGAHCKLGGMMQMLTLMHRTPTASEIRAFRRDELTLAFAVEEGIIFLLYRFGECLIGDASFTVHLLPERPSGDEPENSGRLLVSTILDLSTGLLSALRTTTLPEDFATSLADAIKVQRAQPWNGKAAHLKAIADVQDRLGIEDLFQRALARTVVRSTH